MKKVLITGATGFIGTNLLRYLIKEGKFEIHILTRETSNKWRIKNLLGDISEHSADITDYEKISTVIQDINPEYIFHLATYGGYPRIQKDNDIMLNNNLIGTHNLLKATMDIKYKCFVNTGTSSEYGMKGIAMKETDTLEPNTMYGLSKAASTMLCQYIAREYKKPITTLRLFSVYGYYEEKFRLIPDVILHCLKNKSLSLSAGSQKRDFVFIEDVIQSYIKAIDNPSKEGVILNVGGGVDFTIEDVAKKIVSIMGSKIKLNFGTKKLENFETSVSWKADINRIKSILGWIPKTDLEEGLKKTISWFKSNTTLYD